jgi:hypothetical protein
LHVGADETLLLRAGDWLVRLEGELRLIEGGGAHQSDRAVRSAHFDEVVENLAVDGGFD